MADGDDDALPDTALFVRELYERAGFPSWAEFAREAGVLASSISDWKDGRNSPEGANLLKLIRAVERVAPDAFGSAVKATAPPDIASELRSVREELSKISPRSVLDVLDPDERSLWVDTAGMRFLSDAEREDYLKERGFVSVEEYNAAIGAIESKIRWHPDNARLFELRHDERMLRMREEEAEAERLAGGEAGPLDLGASDLRPDAVRVVAAQIRDLIVEQFSEIEERLARLEGAAAPQATDQQTEPATGTDG